MRFLDANVFVYAYYRPTRRLASNEQQMKELSKQIVTGVSNGKEQVITTVVHLSEMVNILKHGMPLDRLNHTVMGLFMLDNVKICGVTQDAYFAAAELGNELRLEANDALAVDVMRMNDVTEIYSFDEDFDGVKGIVRLPRLQGSQK
jgi:predicted nucleic acid-binding protein